MYFYTYTGYHPEDRDFVAPVPYPLIITGLVVYVGLEPTSLEMPTSSPEYSLQQEHPQTNKPNIYVNG